VDLQPADTTFSDRAMINTGPGQCRTGLLLAYRSIGRRNGHFDFPTAASTTWALHRSSRMVG
jgi:hypothetical protein